MILKMASRFLSVEEARELSLLRDLADGDSDGGEELNSDNFDDFDDDFPSMLADEDEIELVDDDDETDESTEQVIQDDEESRDTNQQQVDPSNIDQTSKAGRQHLFYFRQPLSHYLTFSRCGLGKTRSRLKNQN